MRHRLVLATPLLALALGGCAGNSAIQAYQESIHIPAGSSLTLNRALELPGAGDYLYIQGGRSLPNGNVHRYQPHCYLETESVPEPGTRVEPTRFTVTRVTRDQFYSGLDPAGAATRIGGDDGGGGDGPTLWYFITRLWVEPESDTDVFRISCQADRMDVSGMPFDETHLTVDEVREALGETFTLRLADG